MTVSDLAKGTKPLSMRGREPLLDGDFYLWVISCFSICGESPYKRHQRNL
jgi:hypothetical protein